MDLYTVYADGNPEAHITVKARCHRQHNYTHTILAGVTKTGAHRLVAFCKRYAIVRVDVPNQPLLGDWEGS